MSARSISAHREAFSGRRLSAQQAADRLGVKIETLYAYVSRGMVESVRDQTSGRGSTFNAGEIERLARGRRGGSRAGGIEVRLSSGLTLIENDRLSYRGLDASQLARTSSFESVAELLWGSDDANEDEPVEARHDSWEPGATAMAAGRLAQTALPSDALFADRIRLIVSAIAPTDALRYDTRPESVRSAGRDMISAMVECLPELGPPCDRPLQLDEDVSFENSIAARLWPRLTSLPAARGCIEILNAALILCADHGLAASTFASRVAASVHADPYAVVATGLGVISGNLHGAASAPVYRILAEIGTRKRAVTGVAEVLRRDKRIPGFGHLIYKDWDPRAVALLDMLRGAEVDADRLATCEAVLEVLGQRAPVKPNVDFLLAALAFTTGMDAAAGEAIFAIARTAGWIAHALEEYEEAPVRFRPRAHYTGPAPAARSDQE